MRIVALAAVALVAGGWLTAEHTIWVPELKSGAAHWRAPTAVDSIPRSIDEAEAQGRRYPRSSAPANFNPSARARAITSERRCVRADTARDSRSGDFYTGNFRGWTELWRSGMRPAPKMWWHSAYRPLHVPTQFTLRVARIDTVGPAFVFVSDTTVTRRIAHDYQQYGYTWVTNEINLPTPGTWLFIATAPEAWGCFVVAL